MKEWCLTEPCLVASSVPMGHPEEDEYHRKSNKSDYNNIEPESLYSTTQHECIPVLQWCWAEHRFVSRSSCRRLGRRQTSIPDLGRSSRDLQQQRGVRERREREERERERRERERRERGVYFAETFSSEFSAYRRWSWCGEDRHAGSCGLEVFSPDQPMGSPASSGSVVLSPKSLVLSH